MAKMHIVQQGESVSSIARKYGFPDWQALFDHPDNVDFKQLRPNPDIIYPADKIAIPDISDARFKAKLNQKQVFRTQVKKDIVKLKVGAIGGVVWADRKVELEVDDIFIESKTDSEGIAEFKLPKQCSDQAILHVFTLKETIKATYRIEVKLGHLDPVSEMIGQQARLTALGFDCGSLTHAVTKQYEKALMAFQHEYELDVDGICGPNTQKTLEKEYGC